MSRRRLGYSQLDPPHCLTDAYANKKTPGSFFHLLEKAAGGLYSPQLSL